MPSSGLQRRDFFISFSSADRAWAEWIASELEAAGYTTFFQHWDVGPGSNFMLEMHKAAALSDRSTDRDMISPIEYCASCPSFNPIAQTRLRQ